jgi:hypothetical protein
MAEAARKMLDDESPIVPLLSTSRLARRRNVADVGADATEGELEMETLARDVWCLQGRK